MLRTSESQYRYPFLNPVAARSKVGQFRSLHLVSVHSLVLKATHLAINGGGYVNE